MISFRHRLLSAVALTALGAVTPAFAQEADGREDVAQLSEIVVTATAREQAVRDAPASITVINRETLERQPYREVTDALLEVPGVTVTVDGGRRDISIRGMAPQYTLILVDGRRLSSREARIFSTNISEGGLLPPLEAIERIEVVRGPMSSLYGSDAMGGVINVITRRIGDSWRGSARVNGTLQTNSDYGDFADGNFYVSGPLVGDRLGLQVQGSLNRRAEDDVPGGSPERRDETISAKLGFKADPSHEFLLEGGFYRQEVRSRAGRSLLPNPRLPDQVEFNETQERYVAALSHSGQWGFASSESYLQYEDAKYVESRQGIKNTVGQSIWSVPLPSNMLSLGAFFRHEDLTDLISNGISGRTSAKRTNWALFAENELTVFDGLKLTGGVRMDDDEQYGTHWTPRVYAVWSVTSAFTIKGGYSQGFRAPNLRDTLADWGQLSRGGTIYGNPDLKAETSRTIEAALLYDRPGFHASLTAYDTRFNDKITRITCAQAGAWCVDEPLSEFGAAPTTFVNIDKARVRGIEATVDVRLT